MLKNPSFSKVVYTYGAFDLLHPAHIQLLEKARKFGDWLIVGVLSDDAIRGRKGNDRPIQPFEDRSFIISSLKCVDEVVKQETYDPVPTMQKLSHIDFLTKGDDWEWCEEAIKRFGRGQFKRLSYNDKYSTSDIVRRIRNETDLK